MVQGLFSGPAWVFAFVALCLLVARLTIDEGLMPFHLSSRAQASSAVQLDRLQGSYKACFDPPANHNSTRANAAFVILAREDDCSSPLPCLSLARGQKLKSTSSSGSERHHGQHSQP